MELNLLIINFMSLFKSNGVTHQTTCAYTPQQSGFVEIKHRHCLINVCRDLLFQCGLPLKF